MIDWIAVKDSLPQTIDDGNGLEIYPFVITFSEYEDPPFQVGYYSNELATWLGGLFACELHNVTHWALLNGPQKERRSATAKEAGDVDV